MGGGKAHENEVLQMDSIYFFLKKAGKADNKKNWQ